MFGKLGDMKKMYDKYKSLQDALKKIVIRAKEDGVIIDINAEQKVKAVTIDDESLMNIDQKVRLEKAIKVAFEKGQNKAQEIAMEKTKEILWFDPNDLAGMMWGMWWGGIPGLK